MNGAGILNCGSAESGFFESSVSRFWSRPNTIGSSAFGVDSIGLNWNNSIGPVFSETAGTLAVTTLVSSIFLSLPNIKPPTVSPIFLLGSIDESNLKPAFSVFLLGSTTSKPDPLEVASIFLDGSITFPNLNPEVTLFSFGTSMLAPNLNPVELSSFLLGAPKENPFVWGKDDVSVPNLVVVCCPG